MGSIWGQQDPGGSHVGPMNFAIWGTYVFQMGDVSVWKYENFGAKNKHLVYYGM